jgi:hypothetical protein
VIIQPGRLGLPALNVTRPFAGIGADCSKLPFTIRADEAGETLDARMAANKNLRIVTPLEDRGAEAKMCRAFPSLPDEFRTVAWALKRWDCGVGKD